MQIETCPWAAGAINYNFMICEEALCQWIRQPANTWSSIGMIVVGIFLLMRNVRNPSITDFYSGICITFMGACSFGAHATGLQLFGFLDVASIFIYMSLLAVFSLKRWNLLLGKDFYLFWATVSLLPISSQLLFPKAQYVLLLPFGLFLVFLESRFLLKSKNPVKPTSLFVALGILSLAGTCLVLDYTKTFCQPNNHFFQFHGAWHLLAAIGVYFITN